MSDFLVSDFLSPEGHYKERRKQLEYSCFEVKCKKLRSVFIAGSLSLLFANVTVFWSRLPIKLTENSQKAKTLAQSISRFFEFVFLYAFYPFSELILIDYCVFCCDGKSNS